MSGSDDVAKRIYDLIKGVNGDLRGTRGGRKKGNKNPVRSGTGNSSTSGGRNGGGGGSRGGGGRNTGGDGGGNTGIPADGTTVPVIPGSTGGGDGSSGFANPMQYAWSLIRGGIGGSPVEFPIGPEGTVLGSVGGKLQWVYPTTLGIEPTYLTEDSDGNGTQDQLYDAVTGNPLWQ